MFNAEGEKQPFTIPKQPKVKLKAAPPDQRQIAVIPIRALTDRTLSGGCVRVLALLCSYANRAGITWVGQKRLAQDLQTSHQYISHQISRLKKKGYLETLVPGGKHSHTSTTRVIYNESIKTQDAIGLVNEDVRSPDMKLKEEREMEKKLSKASKRAPKAVKKEVDSYPLADEKMPTIDCIVVHNNVEGIVQEVYRNVFLKDKLINDLDLKGFEWIAMAEILESELRECLELWLRARTGEPETILEFSKSLLTVE